MAKQRHEYRICLRLESPFASQGLNVAFLGVDTHLARDHAGKLIIPGALLRGVLRHTLLEMAGRMQAQPRAAQDPPPLFDEKKVCEWFGSASANPWPRSKNGQDEPAKPEPSADRFAPQRGLARVDDLVCGADEPARPGFLTRIQINHQSGSVETGALQVLEQPFALGAPVDFRGAMTFYGDDAEAKVFRQATETALGFIRALGGVKSAGFGFLAETACGDYAEALTKAATLELVNSQPTPAATPPSAAGPVVFDLRFKDPYLVDAELVALNIYQGREIVPGGVIKGCLARMLELAGESGWQGALQRMRLSHAVPLGPTGDRPRFEPPLTRYRDKAGQEGDLFDHANDFDGLSEEVWFAVDWKHDGDGSDYHVRTRTAMAPGAEMAAESQLFSYRLVKPEEKVLRFTALFAPEDEQNSTVVNTILATLCSGLDFVGKTGARATVTWRPEASAERQARPGGPDGKTWRVVLQTPAALFSPEKCRSDQSPEARALYLQYWRDLLTLWPKAGKLDEARFDFFAAQAWDGGYRAMRYPSSPGRYLPYILTQPGSVFLIAFADGDPAQQRALFAHLIRHGLPVYQAETWNVPEPWRACPYLPENGYGEIIADWEDVLRLRKVGGHA
ncbi:conserved hypothetical protein [Desulfarculus baarsii DSM 2075]|uniref:CRISPR type III-associated protein domain-containing protein n=1 Tax=Desulfarculus baarsii (strain ATCC 33931 / DSM 2075 / LMG 7858 / VKM B-1802 / 2st14) TaxID=644282 RepID=E1QHL4_DESB2|nr:RAMP superfamily CRISPR-associated protein [Desulfarculus baarsii]ADK85057.1 conserved hypothetical protein [Desulfarculus baarsii DSM 2075]